VPDAAPGVYKGLTSAVDVMPTVLEILGQKIQGSIEGRSLLQNMHDTSLSGRNYVISSIPFANPGDPVRSVDDFLRMLKVPTVTTVTAGKWSLIYSIEEGASELYDLMSDPKQQNDIISKHPDVAKELHEFLVKFMRETNVPERLLKPRLELRL
jgi:arylsulfatase A-like enzyme